MPFNLFGEWIPESKQENPPQVSRPIKVREVKRKKALLTCLYNLPLSEEAKQDLLKELKQKLGTGGCIKEGVVEIQGYKEKQVCAFLKDKGFKI